MSYRAHSPGGGGRSGPGTISPGGGTGGELHDQQDGGPPTAPPRTQRGWRRGRWLALALAVALAAVAGILTGQSSTSPEAGGHAHPGTVTSPSPAAGRTPAPAHTHARRRTQAPGSHRTRVTGTRSGVVGGDMFGGDMPLAVVQSKLGRTLAIVRDYYYLGQTFPDPADKQQMAQGTTLLVSLDTAPGGASYASIAAGHQDKAIMAFLRAVQSNAVRYHLGAIYFCFEHEADDPTHHQGLGSPAQFVQAWDHIHALATAAHMDWSQGGRIHWVLILTHGAYSNGQAASYWPGTSEVDVVAVDGYNKGGCQAARGTPAARHFVDGTTPPVSPASLFDPAVKFAAARGGLPVFVAEWGSVPYKSASVRPGFIGSMASYVAANREIAAALYWDSNLTPCYYNVNTSPQSFAALSTMAHSALMQGQPAAG